LVAPPQALLVGSLRPSALPLVVIKGGGLARKFKAAAPLRTPSLVIPRARPLRAIVPGIST
jgi:hypothetical protein